MFNFDYCVVFSVIFEAKASSVLQNRLLGDRSQWTSAVMTWSRLQGELAGRRTTVNKPTTAPTKREEGRGSEERETEQRGEKSSRETCGAEAQTPEKKRKRDDEEKESNIEKTAEEERTSERERKRQDKEDDEEGRRMEFCNCGQNEEKGKISETDLYGRGSVCVHATSEPDHNMERGCRDMAEDLTGENGNKINYFSQVFTFKVADFLFLFFAFRLPCCVCLCVIQ